MDLIYNPLSEGTLKNPYPTFNHLREEHPVYWHEQMKSWVLTDHADCRKVLTDYKIWARDWRRAGNYVSQEIINMQSIDPPDVRPLRSCFINAVESLDLNEIKQFSYNSFFNSLLTLSKSKQFCFMHDFALPVAEVITCKIFGLDPPGQNIFHEIGYGIALQMDSGLVPEQQSAGRKIRSKLYALVEQGFAARKNGGLFSTVLNAFEKTNWSEKILINSMAAMLNAAYSTLYASLGNIALSIIRNPEVLNEINLKNLSLAVDELIRFDSPAQATSRIAVKETTLRDVEFKCGDVVITMLAAANHDPKVFTNPEKINVNRSPNPHLGFAFGPHFCLGRHISQITLQQFLANMIEFPQLRLVGNPIYFRTATLRWLEFLKVSFEKNKSSDSMTPKMNSYESVGLTCPL